MAFIGPDYAQTPALRGAVNRQIPDQHNDLWINPAIIKVYRGFIEGAERGVTVRSCG